MAAGTGPSPHGRSTGGGPPPPRGHEAPNVPFGISRCARVPGFFCRLAHLNQSKTPRSVSHEVPNGSIRFPKVRATLASSHCDFPKGNVLKIRIPNSARLQGAENFLKKVEDLDDPGLVVDLPYNAFSVHPLVIAATAAAGIAAIDRGEEVEIVGNLTGSGGTYLTRMGLFKTLGLAEPVDIVEHEATGRFVSLRVISNGSELTQFIQELAPLLHRTPDEAAAISYAVAELVRNTLEHAGKNAKAVVAANLYPSSGVIGLGVADCGRGIRDSLSMFHKVDDDLAAIQLALRPGVTGTTSRVGGTELNAGAGLFFCKGMAYTSRNYLVVASGRGMFKLLCTRADQAVDEIYLEAENDRATRRLDETNWPGTVVGLDIAGDAHGAFPSFLGYMQKAYAVQVRAAKKAHFKRGAKFT